MAALRSHASKQVLNAVSSLIALLLVVRGDARAELLPFDHDFPVEGPVIRYWENTGALQVRGPNSVGKGSPRMQTITIESKAGVFNGELESTATGLRKASPQAIGRDGTGPLGFDSFHFGRIARPMLPEAFLLDDLSAWGRFTDDSQFGPVDGARPALLDYYPGIRAGGVWGDEQLSIVYDAESGDLSLDVPPGQELVVVNIVSDSLASIFTECAISGSIDPCGDTSFFHATFGDTFSSVSFGSIMEPGLLEQFLVNDLSVVAEIATVSGGGQTRSADLIYVPLPEPSAGLLLSTGLFAVALVFDRFAGDRKGRASGRGTGKKKGKKSSSACHRWI